MTTAVQVKRATRQLLERNGDLALVRGFIFIKPAHHLLRGIFFPRDIDPILFQPTWFVNFLSRPGAGVTDRWGERLYRKTGVPREPTDAETRLYAAQWALPIRERRYPKPYDGGWVSYDPAVAAEMCEMIEQETLPMLRSIQSIDDFVALTGDKTRFSWTYLGSNFFHEPFVFAAQGKFEAALAACARLVAWRPKNRKAKELHRRLAAGDRRGVVRLLHRWEADSVKRLKIDEFWEPTPFPIELSAGHSAPASKREPSPRRPDRRSAKR
jgi:hypothetical protein